MFFTTELQLKKFLILWESRHAILLKESDSLPAIYINTIAYWKGRFKIIYLTSRNSYLFIISPQFIYEKFTKVK